MATKTPKIVNRYKFKTDDPQKYEMGIEYQNSAGETLLLRAPLNWRFRPSNLRDELANADAQGDISPVTLKETLEAPPLEVCHLTRRTGWHGDSYVLPYATIRPGPDGPRHESSLQPELAEWRAGKLRAWKAGLAEICEVSDFAVFSICLGLSAAVLSYFTPAHGLVFNLAGESGAGKTTMLRIAQSVLRRAGESDVKSANMTPTGLEEYAAENNDLISCADELGALLADAREATAFSKILSYRIRQGQGRKRARAVKGTMGYDQLMFRACMLTSSEKPLAILLGPRLPGEEVRLVDLLVPDKDECGVLVRRGQQGALPFASRRELMKRVEKVLEQNYGQAFPKFVAALSLDQSEAKEQARKFCTLFVNGMIETVGVAAEDSRHLEVFGRIYAAGALAVDQELVPFDMTRLGKAMRGVYERSELGRRDAARRVDEALVGILDLLNDPDRTSHLTKSKKVTKEKATIEAVVRQQKGSTVVGVLPDAFEELARPSGLPALLDTLESAGVLMRGQNGVKRQLMAKGLSESAAKPYFYCLRFDPLIELAKDRELHPTRAMGN